MTPTTEFAPVHAPVPAPPATTLNELSDPKTTVRYLRKAAKLTEKELQAVTGADPRTIRRWTAAQDPADPQARYAERIDDLRDLVTLLAATLPDEQTGRWLRARNRLLRGGRPIDLLSAGKYEAVREAAEAFVDGDPI